MEILQPSIHDQRKGRRASSPLTEKITTEQNFPNIQYVNHVSLLMNCVTL
jgi:hypothetical protein